MLGLAQKRQLVEFLADPQQWKRLERLDYSRFLTDKTRKQRVIQKEGAYVQIGTDKDGFIDERSCIVSDDKDNVAVTFRRRGNTLLIKDERGRTFVCTDDAVSRRDDVDVSVQRLSRDEMLDIGARFVEVPYMDAYMKIGSRGEKTIILNRSRYKIDIVAPDLPFHISLTKGAFNYATHIDNALPDALNIQPAKMEDTLKYFVAYDLGIEPDAYTLNEVDSGALRRPWTDTSVNQSRFYIEREDSGFGLRTTFNNYEHIRAQGSLLNAVFQSSPSRITIDRNKIQPEDLLQMLEQGALVKDHNKHDWNLALVHTTAPSIFAGWARTLMKSNFGLSDRGFMVMALDRETCVVAMNSGALKKANQELGATMQLIRMIHEKSRDVETMYRLMLAGADMRLVSPEDVKKGRNFGSMIADSGNTVLLSGYEALHKPISIPSLFKDRSPS